jgi:glycosyltransferase involved in cell wall biosynthesis
MIIGHYAPDLWAKGGIRTYIRHLSLAQQVTGHTIYHFSEEQNPDPPPEFAASIKVTNSQHLLDLAEQFGLDILHIHRPISITRGTSFAIVRTLHGHEPYCLSGSKFLARSHQPCDRAYSLAGCLGGHYIDRCGSRNPYQIYTEFQRLAEERKLLTQVPVLTVSNFLKQQLIDSGYSEQSIRVLPLFASNLQDYIPPPQQGIPHFLFIGRMVPQKGLDWLLRALCQISVPIHLDIAGEGYLADELYQLASQLGVCDRVTFHGWVIPEQIIQLMQSARAIIFPSLWHEPAGFVTLEAATAGRAVIASRVGAIPEYSEPLRNGLLINPGNTQQLAEAISQLATDWQFAKQLGEQGRDRVQAHFSLNQHINQLNSFYQVQLSNQPIKVSNFPKLPHKQRDSPNSEFLENSEFSPQAVSQPTPSPSCHAALFITVLIPTYRRPHALAYCLKALEDQFRPPNEVILVIRDRDPETHNFLKTLNSNLPLRVITVTLPGVVAALNAGLDPCKGDIIAITDDDAVAHPDWLSRLESYYLANPKIGGVGGRDRVYHGTHLESGTRPTVGQVQWFGRVIGNHHLGVGTAREVDVLKGVNMSFRRAAIAGIRCDERLKGTGAQAHFEIALSLAVKQRGWKLIYDPAIAVDHYPAQRFDEDQRVQFNAQAWSNRVHNETLVLLDYLSLPQRIIYLIWAIIVGTREAQGIVQLIRFLPSQGQAAFQTWRASMAGRWQGLQTWSNFSKSS